MKAQFLLGERSQCVRSQSITKRMSFIHKSISKVLIYLWQCLTRQPNMGAFKSGHQTQVEGMQMWQDILYDQLGKMQEGEWFKKLHSLSFWLLLRYKVWAQASHEKETWTEACFVSVQFYHKTVNLWLSLLEKYFPCVWICVCVCSCSSRTSPQWSCSQVVFSFTSS